MQGTGIPGRRARTNPRTLVAPMSRLLATATLSVSGLVVLDVPNLAPGDGPYEPPSVDGEPLPAALEELAAWAEEWWQDPDRQPSIEVVPSTDGIDPAFVFVLRQDVRIFDDVAPPDVLIEVGVEVPALVGLALDAATESSAARRFELIADDPDASAGWTVIDQRPGAGEVVELGTAITVAARAPAAVVTPEPPPVEVPTSAPTPGSTADPSPAAGPIDGGTALLLLLACIAALAAAALLVRGATRPRPARSDPGEREAWAARIRVEVRAGPPPESGIEEHVR